MVQGDEQHDAKVATTKHFVIVGFDHYFAGSFSSGILTAHRWVAHWVDLPPGWR